MKGALLILLAIAPACGGDVIRGASADAAVPTSEAGLGVDADAASVTEEGAGPDAEAGSGQDAANSALDGSWTGYVENFKFPSGTDTLSMVLAVGADGSVTGRVVFGSGQPPSPATNPMVGYPLGIDFSQGSTALPRVVEDFVYTVIGGTLTGSRLQFGVSGRQVWTGWCALQSVTYLLTNSNTYQCLPNWGFSQGETGCSQTNPATNQPVVVDCGKLVLCDTDPVCLCDVHGCSGDTAAPTINFDLAVSGASADGAESGALTFPDSPSHTVHFTHS